MNSPHYIPSQNSIASVITGNGCGHNANNLRVYSPTKVSEKNRPSLIEKAKEELSNLRDNPMAAFVPANIFHHEDKVNLNGQKRKKRSEIREAILVLSGVIFHTVNLESGVCGYEVDNEVFIYSSLRYFAKEAGISYQRALKAFNILRDAGMISLTKRMIKRADGSRALNPIIRVYKAFFLMLGIDEKVVNREFDRDTKLARLVAREEQIAKHKLKAIADWKAFKKKRKEERAMGIKIPKKTYYADPQKRICEKPKLAFDFISLTQGNKSKPPPSSN